MKDFSETFDAADCVTLLTMLISFAHPTFVVNLKYAYISDRGQQYEINGCVCGVKKISLSFVQGSGMRPTLYISVRRLICILSSV